MRRLNARRVLDYAWVTDAFTASDVMTTTTLSRSTVIGVCDDLVRQGWLKELGDARAVGEYRNGRPARRYALRDEAAVVIGVDAGHDAMSATVADLRGCPVGRAQLRIPAATPQGAGRDADADRRRALAREVVDEALRAAGVVRGGVLAVTVGVPAPVDVDGASPVYGTGFWHLMNPGFRGLFSDCAPIVTVENDANLAAIGEQSALAGSGRDVDSFIAILVGEGIGAGLMIDRRLVRGRRGGAGEMRILDHVNGVGSADGLGLCARRWATHSIRSGTLPRHSLLRQLDPATLQESDVALAAAAGDAVAADILERLSARLARICLVLGEFLDVDRIVVVGSVVESLPAMIRRAAAILGESDDPAVPALVASRLGADAVSIGAVEHALAQVRERVFELSPAAH